MIYCFTYSSEFIELVNNIYKNLEVCFYDKENDLFVDKNGLEVDIKGKTVYPQTSIQLEYTINDSITKKGGTPLVSNEETDVVLSWPKYYKTKRNTMIFTGYELLDQRIIDKIKTKYNNDDIFFKTKDKNFASIIPIEALENKNSIFHKALEAHCNEEYIISDCVEVLNDELGRKEYRCFVLNNEVYNISRHLYHTLHQIDQKILDYAESVTKKVAGVLPACYVMDIFEYQKDGKEEIDVGEFNPIQASGKYIYNSPFYKSDDLLHNDMNNLPIESADTLITTEKESVSPSVFYSHQGTFAGDLLSLSIVGKIGYKIIDYKPLSKDDFIKNVTPLVLNFIVSDEQLADGPLHKKTRKIIKRV